MAPTPENLKKLGRLIENAKELEQRDLEYLVDTLADKLQEAKKSE